MKIGSPGRSLYSYSSATKLIQALHLANDWTEVAVALEDQLGWYARELGSLGELICNVPQADLERIFHAMGQPLPKPGANLPAATASVIYKLRNDLVHFRPMQHRVDYGSIEWNRLCTAAAVLVWHVYSEAFPVAA